jgi:hypothetical protein
MNGEDQFENRLRCQTPRSVPPAWREEILRTAHLAASSAPMPARRSVSSPSIFASWVWSLLWPHPWAWAGLAALWLVVVGVNLASQEPVRQELADRPTRVSPQMRELLKQQEQLLAELVGPMGKADAKRPKPAALQPRSQRRSEFLNA